MINNNPVFISGLYRSGTTLLNRMLNQHINIRSTYDTIHYMRFSYNKYSPIEQNYKEIIVDTANRIKKKWDINLDINKTFKLLENQPITESSVYDSIMKSFLNINDEVRWCEKTNVEWESIPKFLDMFPNAKVIHIFRDPRAVLASYREMTIHKKEYMYLDAIFASLAMFNFINKIEIKSNPNILLIKYENFVSNPIIITKTICDFLNIHYSDKMIDVNSYKDKFGNKFDTDSSFTSQKNKIDTSSISLWENTLSNVEIYLCEKILKKHLIKYEYSLKNLELKPEDQNLLNTILNTPFIRKRYTYYLKYSNGQQAYPDTFGAYEINTNEK